MAIRLERHEADAALEDERMAAVGDDVTEPHTANRVERQPRLHPHLDREPVESDVFTEGPVRMADQGWRRAGLPGDDEVIGIRDRNVGAAGEGTHGLRERVAIQRKLRGWSE